MKIERIVPPLIPSYCTFCFDKKGIYRIEKNNLAGDICESCFDELRQLEKPKNKVKKYKWSIDNNGIVSTTERHFTKEQIDNVLKSESTDWFIIYGTEIEVEE